MDRTFFLIGSVSALLAVACGAFGAHALKDRMPGERMEVFKTATQYQMYHSLALLAASFAAGTSPGGLLTATGWLFVAGIVLFSGSLYALALSGVRMLGAITPLGGLCFLFGWACLAVGVWRR